MFSYSLCVRGCPRSLGNPVPSQLGSLGQTEPLGKGPHTLHFKSMLQTSSPKVKIVFFFSPPPAPTTPYCFCLSFSDDFLSSFLVHETSVICCRHSYLWGQPHSRCHLPKKKKGLLEQEHTGVIPWPKGHAAGAAQCLGREGSFHRQLIKQCFVWETKLLMKR